jgi:beta-D-xylosidase 4
VGRYSLLLDVPRQARVDLTLVGQDVVLDRWPQPPTGRMPRMVEDSRGLC